MTDIQKFLDRFQEQLGDDRTIETVPSANGEYIEVTVDSSYSFNLNTDHLDTEQHEFISEIHEAAAEAIHEVKN